MGIKHLWTILAPFGERKPLFDLQGKVLAIDLSCWICEAQNITEYYVQPKMYLRNLYFRTCYLLLMDVTPVFVLEGKAPELKYNTIAARNEIQFKGAKPKSSKTKTNKDRTRFTFVLKSCEEMLGLMGLACVKGNGEAEALCATLNSNKLVDGCISQDSDCFAYGAKVVYRNFSISQQGAHGATGGAIDVYNIEKVKESMGLGRNKIIALALLCGSDYNDSGIFGVGKEAAIKLFENIEEKDILSRLRSWRRNADFYDELFKKLNDKNICKVCGHQGKTILHTNTGCKECRMSEGCDSNKFNRAEIKNEVSVRNKALACDANFPNEALINEFLVPKENVSKLDLEWKCPDLIKFIKFTSKHLQWEEIYAFQKFFPILTRWHLKNNHFGRKPNNIVPKYIKKIRNPKGVASYEIVWLDPNDIYKNQIPAEQLDNTDLEKLWSTIEPQALVRSAYPDAVKTFEETKKKKQKKAPSKRKAMKEIENMMANTSITETKQTKKTKTISSYFKKAVINKTVEEAKNNQDISFNFDMSRFGDEEDLDLSDIVQEIISRTPPKYIGENLNKLRDDAILNETSFFATGAAECDLFEKSMIIPDSSDDDDDSFSEEYVPLINRLKRNVEN